MKPYAVMAVLALALAAPATQSQASVVEKACLKSSRRGVSKALCGCIQEAADLTLTRKDQKIAASFFQDPHRAQEIRQSDDDYHESFWKKYKSFGATAETYCR